MPKLEWIRKELLNLREQSQHRCLDVFPATGGKIKIDGKEYLNFSSNDYLHLANHPQLIAEATAMLQRYGASAASSRLVTGTLPCHAELENLLAAFKKYPAALVYGSGWLANISVIPALVGRNDQIFIDRLAHASLLDAAILSRAKIFRFQHNNVEHLQDLLQKSPKAARRLIVTEAVFSMDGDIAPLVEMVAAAKEFEAMMMVDEAHATGIFGSNGSGVVQDLGLCSEVDIVMGTFGKALGSYGGYVACSNLLRDFLINKSRAFITTTALPPMCVGAAKAGLEIVMASPNLGKTLLQNSFVFRDKLRKAGLNIGNSNSQIIPIIVGDNDKALCFGRRLKEHGVIAVAIRPPSVPKNSSRVRLTVTLAHSVAALNTATQIIIACAQAEGLIA